MIFENLSEKIQRIFKKFQEKGFLTEKDVSVFLREIRLVLLEADVNLFVVKKIISKVSERAAGSEILESLSPHEQMIKILKEELIEILGKKENKINFSSKIPSVIMLVGLQGSGKTTTVAKLALFLKNKYKKNPLLCACDVYRPAATEQLEILGRNSSIPVFTKKTRDADCPKSCMLKKNCESKCKNAVQISKESISYALTKLNDVVIVDTAGRLQTDEALMNELVLIKKETEPCEILLAIDSQIGQEARNISEAFDKYLDLTGIILTKLDGDSRGGAALSVRDVTGKPIKLFGTGEKLSDIEVYYPKRIVERILGMGDVLTLIEKAEQAFDEKNAKEFEEKLQNGVFTYEDFLTQMTQFKKIGSIKQIFSMMPGVNSDLIKNANIDDKKILKIEAIIKSMTNEEKRNKVNINSSRKKRIAKGSGVSVNDVNILIKQHEQMQKIFKLFSFRNKNIPKGFKFAKKNKKNNFPF